MNKADTIKRQTELLKALNKEFTEAGNDTEYTTEDQNGLCDMITCEFNTGINSEPVLAQYFFLKANEEDMPCTYFAQSLVIIDDIEDETKKMEMLQAIAVLNFNTPYGSFIFDPDIEVLSYRYVVPVDESMDRNDALKLISRESYTGLGIVGVYIAAINAFFEDRIDWDEYLESLGALNESMN